jgi:hypothetical protein
LIADACSYSAPFNNIGVAGANKTECTCDLTDDGREREDENQEDGDLMDDLISLPCEEVVDEDDKDADMEKFTRQENDVKWVGNGGSNSSPPGQSASGALESLISGNHN